MKTYKANVSCRKQNSIGVFSMKTVFVRIPENTPECDLRTTVRDAAFDDLNFCGFECSHMPQWEECENVWIPEN